MAKGSNTTRSGGASTRASTTSSNNVLDALAKDIRDNYGEIDYRKFGWDVWDNLSEAQVNSVLEKAQFTGATSDDLWSGTLYMPETESTMVERLEEALVNESWGNHDDDSSWTVGYKDGSRKYLDSGSNDFDMKSSSAYKQSYKNAHSAIDVKNVAFIVYSGADGQPTYAVRKGGEQAMRDYGFDFWEKGKRR